MTAIAQPLTEYSDPYCLREPAAAALLYDAPWRRFAAIGDSLSLGVSDPSPGYANLGWADRVSRILRLVHPDLAYLNTGRVGATTAQALTEQSRAMLDFGPDLLYVPSGANDLVRREPDFEVIEHDLTRMYELAVRVGAQPLAFTLGRAYVVPVFPDWRDRVRRVNDITRTLAAKYGAVLADVWDHPLNDRENLLSADGIHFSTSGQAVLAAEIVKQLAYRLGSA
ncbi:SGNH/GDSL hydrolase family protein [Nocardia sp. NPDC088792]|uniref:SGNH/GDSL hydrolase family protein n=1 Tax=Nocardia sp. NPDC088792 TaxID=3364332 RepID=UPI00382366B3